MAAVSDEQAKRDAQDQALEASRDRQREKARKRDLRWRAAQQQLAELVDTVRTNSLCLCEVEDSDVPCWQHEPTALGVLWAALGGEDNPAQWTRNANTWSFFFDNADERYRFIRPLGVPATIRFTPDSRGYRLYSTSNMKGSPKAYGLDLVAALKRYQAKMLLAADPNGVIVEKTRELTFSELQRNYPDAVDEVLAKIRSGRSSRTLPLEDFTWKMVASAPNGSKGGDYTVVLTVVLMASRRGGWWKSSALPTAPRIAEAYWHGNVLGRERREARQTSPRKTTRRRNGGYRHRTRRW